MVNNKLNRLAVFCGAFSGNRPEYLQAANDLANVLVSANIELVYGGGNAGMMGQLGTEMLKIGGKVIGVMPSFLVEKEVAKTNLTELHVVDSMQERKLLLANMADGFVMLPGGVGTLDEFFEVFTLAKIGQHHKPCGILNIANFYDILVSFLKKTVTEGFLDIVSHEMIIVENHPNALLQRFVKYRSPLISTKASVAECY